MSQSTHAESCPVCESSFSRDDVEEAQGAVLAHMAASTDEDHQGIGYQKAKNLVELEDQKQQTEEQSSEHSSEQRADGGDAAEDEQELESNSSTGYSNNSSESNRSSSSSTSSSGSVFAAPDPDAGASTAEGSDHSCPHCGAEINNAEAVVADGEPARGRCSNCDGQVVIKP